MIDPLVQMNARLQQNQGGNSAMDALQQGMQTGLVLQQLEQQKRDDQLAQNAMIRRNVMLQQLTSTPPSQRTAQMYVDYAIYHPQEAANMKQQWDILSKEAKDDTLRFTGQAMSLDAAGRTEEVNQMFNGRAEQERLAGNMDMARYYNQMATIPPAQRTAAMGIMASTVPEGEKLLSSLFAAQKQPGEMKIQGLDIAGKGLENAGRVTSNAAAADNLSILPLKNDLALELTRAEIEAKRAEVGAKQRAAVKETSDIRKGRAEVARTSVTLSKIDNLVKEGEALTQNFGENAPAWVKGTNEAISGAFGQTDNTSTQFKQKLGMTLQGIQAEMLKAYKPVSNDEMKMIEKLMPNVNSPMNQILSFLKYQREVIGSGQASMADVYQQLGTEQTGRVAPVGYGTAAPAPATSKLSKF